jgi:hypothetical protein
MTQAIEINGWNKDRTISAIVKATFPQYRRHKVVIRASETVYLQDLNWSGGTRSEYRACTVAGEAAGSTAKYNQCAPWANPAEGQAMPVPAGMIVVRGGYFCGKESLLCLHVNPADMPKYLPAN